MDATELREQSGNGIVYPSVRHASGICVVAFRPHIVQNVRPGARWQLVWDGSASYSIRGA